eukprot:GEMP01000524.1.p1 GENE.GEMP01000524.1~~GEMP01000524.1.p1  ORF type:complete len:1866 (+),score=394.25 GEMP01000524.1:193-5790(+)
MVKAVVLGGFEPTGAKFLNVKISADLFQRTFTFAKQINGIFIEEEVFLHKDRVIRVAGGDVIHGYHIPDMEPHLALFTRFDLAPSQECLVVIASAGARINTPDQIHVYQQDGHEYGPKFLPPRVSVVKAWPVANGILLLTKSRSTVNVANGAHDVNGEKNPGYDCWSLLGHPLDQLRPVAGITKNVTILDVLPDYPVAFGYIHDLKRHACFLLRRVLNAESILPRNRHHDVHMQTVFVDSEMHSCGGTKGGVLLYWGSYFLRQIVLNPVAGDLLKLCHPVSNRFTAVYRTREVDTNGSVKFSIQAFRMHIALYPLSPTLAAVSQALHASLGTAFLVDLWRDVQSCCFRKDARTSVKVDPEWRAFCMLCFTLIEQAFGKPANFTPPPTVCDWDWLLSSGLHLNHRCRWSTLSNSQNVFMHPTLDDSPTKRGLALREQESGSQPTDRSNGRKSDCCDKVSPKLKPSDFMRHFERLFLTMHLLYEDTRLHSLSAPLRYPLGHLLYGMARRLRMHQFVDYYARVDPSVSDPCEAQANFGSYAAMWQERTKTPSEHEDIYQQILLQTPPCLLDSLKSFFDEKKVPVTYPAFFPLSNTCLEIYSLLTSTPWHPSTRLAFEEFATVNCDASSNGTGNLPDQCAMLIYVAPVDEELAHWNMQPTTPAWEKVLHLLVTRGVTKTIIDLLNAVLALPIRECLQTGAELPSMEWPDNALALLGRDDIAVLRGGTVAARSASKAHGAGKPQQAAGAGTAAACASENKNDLDAWALGNELAGSVEEEKALHCVSESIDPIESDEWIFSIPYETENTCKDRRAKDVANFLNSARPVVLTVTRRPEQSDHEFEQFKQSQLAKAVNKQAGLPIGRGAFTLGALMPFPTEELVLPPLVLAGRFRPHPAIVSLDPAHHDADLIMWAEFNNGVARALQVADASTLNLTRGWIVHHKNHWEGTGQALPAVATQGHAGFLFGLGLRGHLKVLQMSDCYKYFKPQHEATTVAILIGVAASYMGTMMETITRMMCMHIPSTLSASYSDVVEMVPSVQCAALVGLGLLYAGSEHRSMTELILGEINRQQEDKPFVDRDCYSLAAGWALGMICLGGGAQAPGLADLRLDERLIRYIHGGMPELPLPGAAKQEGQSVAADPATCSLLTNEAGGINLCATSPGGCMALALLYLQTNNRHIAERIEIPQNSYRLDYNRPGLTLLRILARALIMWGSIEPTQEWIQSEIPPFLSEHCGPVGSAPRSGLTDVDDVDDLDWLLMWQTQCCLVAGLCMAMGLRFAGTGHRGARDVIISHLKWFRDRKRAPNAKGTISHQNHRNMPLDRTTLENCQCVTALALSIVASGTGDLECLRVLRSLRQKADLDTSYSTHMSTHMAIGFLFLGGGRYAFQRDKKSVACLLMAVYPRFPMSLTDNRADLQPFRHLYALATQPKCIDAKDVSSGQNVGLPVSLSIGQIDITPGTCAGQGRPSGTSVAPMHANTTITMRREDSWANDVEMSAPDSTPATVITTTLPRLLPGGYAIERFEVKSDRYWPLQVDRGTNGGRRWLDAMVARGTALVKKRTGHLSHEEDPWGHHLQGWFPAFTEPLTVDMARMLQVPHEPNARDPAGLPIHWFSAVPDDSPNTTAASLRAADLLPQDWASVLCCAPKNILPEHVYHFDFDHVQNRPLQRYAPQLEELRDNAYRSRAHLLYECIVESKVHMFPALVHLEFNAKRPYHTKEFSVIQSFYDFFTPDVFHRPASLVSDTFLKSVEVLMRSRFADFPEGQLLEHLCAYYRLPKSNRRECESRLPTCIIPTPLMLAFVSYNNMPSPERFHEVLRTCPKPAHTDSSSWALLLWLKNMFPELAGRLQPLTVLSKLAARYLAESLPDLGK